MPLIYLFGWLSVQPLMLIWGEINADTLSLIGTFLTFIYFILLLPSWMSSRWSQTKPWIYIGINSLKKINIIVSFFKGIWLSLLLILLVLFPLFCGSWIQDFDSISRFSFINAIALGLGVGIAEELIFRGWLMTEMCNLLGPRLGIIVQAIIFSLAHIRFKLDFLDLIPLLLGLFLLGIVLAIRRVIDNGSLWGSIGIHGGLVGIWFAINSGLINFSVNTPSWLIGPGEPIPNPIGGLVAITALIVIIIYQRNAFSRIGRFSFETFRASSKGAIP